MRILINVIRVVLICVLAVAVVRAEEKPAAAATAENPLVAHNRTIWQGIKGMLLASAEKMPEESYSFKPTEVVRSYGQVLGHVADSQYHFCSIALGDKNPRPNVEKTKTSKADLISALKDAFAYCDKAYAAMTSETATQSVNFMGEAPRLGVLNVNQLHTIEHYGNLVTYLRMKNIVPPTSDPEVMKQIRQRVDENKKN